MLVLNCDPAYTERLAAFLSSLGQAAVVGGPDRVELKVKEHESSIKTEVEIYLGVWNVMYPEAAAELEARVR
jgi:hypothetical protein